MEFEFVCDATKESKQAEYIESFTHHDPGLIIKWANKDCCPVSVPEQAASPTPEPWHPDSEVLLRDPEYPTYAIQMDTKDIDNGRFGVHAPLFWNMETGDVKYVFIHPTDRMMGCPGSYCNADYSSAWVCEIDEISQDPFGDAFELFAEW